MSDDSAHDSTIIGSDGSLTIPAFLLRTLLWQPGQQVLLEQTDDGLLVTEPGTSGGMGDVE